MKLKHKIFGYEQGTEVTFINIVGCQTLVEFPDGFKQYVYSEWLD